MSVLSTHIRGVIFSNLRKDMDPALQNGLFDLISALDEDLNIAEYSPSSTTDEVIERFEALLKGTHRLPDLEEDDALVVTEVESAPSNKVEVRISETVLDDEE